MTEIAKNLIFPNLAERVDYLPESFIREILKITTRPDIISFAGGLPNPKYFPEEKINEATDKVLSSEGKAALQYTVTEGFPPLKEFISNRYKEKRGLDISTEEILILNGSQQGIDLSAKAFLNSGDPLLLENPTFIGALQSYSIFKPDFLPVDLDEDGPDLETFEQHLSHQPKIFYCVPNFQNPTGKTYSTEKRKEIASMIEKHPTVIVEDDPYSEINFTGRQNISFSELIPEKTILLGSFSKIIAPGLRMGWLAAHKSVIRTLVLLKQASDVHSNHLAQRIVHRFLMDNDIDDHIKNITHGYKHQCEVMIETIKQHFPEEVEVHIPEGGMFLWATLPDHISSYAVLDKALEQKVAFVPGKTFYPKLDIDNTFRLNFSNSNPEKIREGIERLGEALKKTLER